MILGTAEAYSSKNTLGKALTQAFGVGIGFIFAIFCMGALREVLGNGTFAEIPVFSESYEPWVIMILPGGGFFALGVLLLAFNALQQKLKSKEK